MPFEMIRNDITRMRVDAIVNAANNTLLGGGGVDGAIHKAAGPELLEECRGLNGCETGNAKITKGYRLPARYVIHVVGPIWRGGGHGERELLASCYRKALKLAAEHACETLAFPLISTGAYGYPQEEAIAVAVEEISRFLLENEMMVYLVLFGKGSVATGKKLFRDVREFIDDVYAESHYDRNRVRERWEFAQSIAETTAPKAAIKPSTDKKRKGILGNLRHSVGRIRPGAEDNELPEPSGEPLFSMKARDEAAPEDKAQIASVEGQQVAKDARIGTAPKTEEERLSAKTAEARDEAAPDWRELLRKTDEGFSETLMRLIVERGMTDTECYKRANVDRKLFSKIRSNTGYKPSKPTACAFAIALRLNMEETRMLLNRAGFALTRSSKFDIVIVYCILHRIYDIYEINEVLFEYDQPLLGSGMSG